ncbi:WD repeat and FYVE domain-containing protein 3 [Folsomia candida]|uniref:WD repeat and FYVE domain-containing protein 3 n=1 Tax=Folsomia candida TaxID=158441 RepID=A0A226ERL1_FOLCA|nr:WD repeat and FYVE domain-containing protein 3 [Folsomia candida]
MQQLLMSQGGEEDMSTVLVLLHSSDCVTELELKIEILSALLSCFRESHRARTNFRKAGGFLYLMSVLVSMEGQLAPGTSSVTATSTQIREKMHTIQLIFTCFALAMRFEPANAKLFHQEICLPSLADTLRLLGCFSRENQTIQGGGGLLLPPPQPPTSSSSNNSSPTLTNSITNNESQSQQQAFNNVQLLSQPGGDQDKLHVFHTIFTTCPGSVDPLTFQDKVPLILVFAVFVFRLLYDLATDNYERNPLPASLGGAFRSPRKQISGDDGGTSTAENSTPTSPAPGLGLIPVKKSAIGSLNFCPPTPEPVVIHSAVVIVMIKLIPSVFIGDSSSTSNSTGMQTMCQLFCAELVKSLVRSEKNQQVMSQAGLTEDILEHCSVALSDEQHPLHQPIHYAFERVATHCLSSKDLRRFMRLGNPLNCERNYLPPVTTLSSSLTYGPVPLSRVKSLVSMTTPKSSNSSNMSQSSTQSSFYSNSTTPFPSFIEFDMSAEGFGCLFLPSIAPSGLQATPDFSSATLLATGMGMGERGFPGTTGMGYSTWFCVDKFSDPRADPHPIRILTVVKEVNGTQRLTLCITVSARDKALLVSTRETQLPPQGIGEWEPDVSPPHSVRVWCPDLIHENQWCHLFFTFSPSSNHPFTIYINGRSTHSCKLDYPHRTKGASYSAFIGTPPAWRKLSRLTWRQGVCHLFEDWVPNSQTVHTIWKLGPEYPGSWQAVKLQSDNHSTLVAEDKIMFGLNALAVSQLTLAKIRKLYSKTDAKAIAKQLGLSSHENATPISILHNSAVHLMGPSRCLGGVVIGYLGVRIFHPEPVAKGVLSVGGIPILIGLVAMATTGESLYAALKALVCVVKSNSVNGLTSANLLDRGSSQMLGYLLKKKKSLLSMRVLHLVFGLVSTECGSIKENGGGGGFNDLLGDLDIWCGNNVYFSHPSPCSDSTQVKSDQESVASTPCDFLGASNIKPTVTLGAPDSSSSQQQPQTHFDFSHADLEKALYEHFLQMLAEDSKNSLEILRDATIVPKLLRRLSQSSPNQQSIFLLLSHLLAQNKGVYCSQDLITFGHFVVGALPVVSVVSSSREREASITETIELRNKCLQLIHSLMYTGKVLNIGFCEELVTRLGFDFVLLFAAPHLHPSTILWSLRILLLLLTSSPALKSKFRDGASSAFCFGRTITYHSVSGQRGAILPLKKQDSKLGIGDDDSPGGSSPVSSAGATVASIASGLTGKGSAGRQVAGGWGRLSWLLGQRCEDVKTEGNDILPTEVWLIMCAMTLSQPLRNVNMKVGEGDPMTLDAIWHYVFALPSSKMTSSLYGKVNICPDAIITLLNLVRCFITAESSTYSANSMSGSSPYIAMSPTGQGQGFNYQSDVGSCIIQFLCYLYSHTPEFQSVFTSAEILSALAATVMPIEVKQFDTIGPADLYDCEEVKTFADSEPLVVLGQKIDRLNSAFDNDDDIITGTEMTDSGILDEHANPVVSKEPKLGEVVHDFPHDLASAASNLDNVMSHPAKKIILDVLRMIIIDWMSASGNQTQSKSPMNMNLLIDTVLDAGNNEAELSLGLGGNSPSGNCPALINTGVDKTTTLAQFHTSLLGTLLDHLIAGHALAFDLDRMTTYLHSVALFLSRLVDKLWLERELILKYLFVKSFSRDPQVVLDYLLVLINHCRSKRTPPATTDLIFNSFNRVVLFVLSRRANQWDKVETLKKLRTIRTVIFGAGNHQQEFFGCLTHVLMQLIDGLPIALESANKTQWHVRVTPRPGEEIHENADIESRREQREAARLDSEISTTAEKVWEDLFISKKPMVEDTFKISFSSPKPPSLSSLRDQIGDSANKLWLTYVASETNPGSKKHKDSAAVSQSWEIHQQLQSKLQKVTGGLTRLAGRSGIRKDSEKEKTTRELVTQWPESRKAQNVGIRQTLLVKEILESQEKFYGENIRHLNRFVRDTLLPELEVELTRERGLWGPFSPSHLDKWMMDTTEGPCRMRKKMIRNEMFYIHYPFTGDLQNTSTSSIGSATSSPKIKRINPPISKDSREFYKRFRHQISLVSETISGCTTSSILSTSSVDESDDGMTLTNLSTSSDPTLSPKSQLASASDDPFSDCYVEAASTDNQFMLSRLIGSTNEKISQIFRVAQIQGLDTAEGLLLFGKDDFYLVSGFTILKTREIKDLYYLPPNAYEPILPPQCYGGSGPSPAKPRTKTHTCLKFRYEDIREVHKRRYLLQPIALEIFLSDGRNHLLAYPRKIRNVVFSKFTSVSKNLSDSGTDAKQSVAGQRRTANVEQSPGLLSSLIGDTSVTQRWVRGEISNFQYLMHMNTLAGRSYNDLMQYPVFPWILADYDSDFIDLNDITSFRDLSKPMGAQSSGRLGQFVKRYKEWDDPHGETPPYHYGTHYSSAMIVCSYLVRMEPFAQHFLRLQGGHFDLADRMFHSIKEAWTSASRHNMADVKELIPEFFYLPDFLMNNNNFDLGNKQNGVALNDVILPPWAKGDAREFIRVNRMALESDYVSSHLHEWIDLIFGYRQQGPPAVEAVNVFHHLFYEGNVDIYSIDDPLEKNATIGFINNFGQIPKQLFKKPHPIKRVTNNSGSTSSIGGMSLGIGKPYNLGILQLDNSNPISALAATAGALAGHAPSGEKVFFHHIGNLRPTLTPVKELKGPVGQIMGLEKPNCVIAVEQNKCFLSASRYISWGYADCSVRVCHAETDRPLFVWEQQQQHLAMGSMGEIVCCSASDKLVVTGSTNTVVSVWDVCERELKLKSHLFGHSESITCLAISPSYNIIVSGSKDMTCIVWDLARLSFVRQLVPHSAPIDAVGVNELTGDIATCSSSWLHLWSVNGELIGRIDTAGVGGGSGGGVNHGILCVSFSILNEWDSDNVVMTGSMDGIVRSWSIRYVQGPIRKKAIGDIIKGKSSEDDEEDSSLITEDSDTEEIIKVPPFSAEAETDGAEKDGGSHLAVEVFDPDKDRDSLEDVHEAVKTEANLSDNAGGLVGGGSNEAFESGNASQMQVPSIHSPVVIRRQRRDRIHSSDSDKQGTGGKNDAENKRAKRRSEIPSSLASKETEAEFQRQQPDPQKQQRSSLRIRGSKSETSLSFEDESFEVVSESEIARMRHEERKMSHGAALLEAHKLREGYVWERKIIFRGKMTMHTAYDRKDNTEPASITAISVSK